MGGAGCSVETEDGWHGASFSFGVYEAGDFVCLFWLRGGISLGELGLGRGG